MNKYLRYFREHINLPYMRPPIGIIMCKSVDAEEVYYALEGLEKKIFIAEYQIYLPTQKQLVKVLKLDTNHSHLGSIRISERQRYVLKELEKLPGFRANDYKSIASISLATAQRDIQQLVREGILTKTGQGKNTLYVIHNGICENAPSINRD